MGINGVRHLPEGPGDHQGSTAELHHKREAEAVKVAACYAAGIEIVHFQILTGD